MDHYIIRIYRRDKTDSRVLVGILEDVDNGEKRPFTRSDELWELLKARRKGGKRPDDRQRKNGNR
jgi:hypothetical protein